MPSANQPRMRSRPRLSLTAAAVVWACLAVLPWTSSFGPLNGHRGGVFAAFLVTAVPGFLILAASRRPDLLGRLRQALALLAFSMLLTAGGNFLRLLSALGVALPTVAGLDFVTTLVIWALGLAALIRLPLTPLVRGAWWRIAIDITIAVFGMALAIFFLWTLPGMLLAPPSAHLKILLYNSMEAANLIVLNLILVRGPLRPIRRAVWWLSATIVIETIYLIAVQYALGRQSHDFRLPNSLFFADYLAYLYVGASFLTDPQPDTDVPLLPAAMRAFNPLPMLSVLGVGGMLILSALRSDPASIPLAAGLVFMAILLFGRVIGATWENLHLLQEEAAEDRRRHAEKVELMGRLAGGVAHIINNRMTVVLGYAELAREETGQGRPIRGSLEAIGEAAQGAAALAERLLLASGRRRTGDHELRQLGEIVRLERESMEGMPVPDHEVIWELADAGSDALISPPDLKAILRELVSNAVDATPAGGRITIRVRGETLSAPPPGMSPSLLPGRYSVLEVADTGRGIGASDLPRIFAPFFTSKPLHEGRGLGLCVVHGIASSYGGGVLVDTTPGAGTRVGVYVPVTPIETR